MSAEQASVRKGLGWQIALAAAGIVLFIGGVIVTVGYYPWAFGQEQPIPFSHRFHVTTKHLSCVFCHTGAIHGESAGIPPLETCMLCHKQIIVEHPEIKKLAEFYNSGTPVPWVRVNPLREFVFFSHEAHVRRGFDCAYCHGDISNMDRVVPAYTLNKMGFCVQCHRENNGSHDCLICHR
jgi:hypothetical protein